MMEIISQTQLKRKNDFNFNS